MSSQNSEEDSARPHRASPAKAATETRQPGSPKELFWSFQKLALQGFGGVLPVAQRELVERRRWMDHGQFLELLSLSQLLPGPNIINLAILYGDRCFGWRGALAGMGGLMLMPLMLMLALSIAYGGVAREPVIDGALRGIGAVVAGLVVATASKLFGSLKGHPLGRSVCLLYAAITAFLVAGLRWPLVSVVLLMGAVGMAHVAWTLHRSAPR